jgi:hypothetical protein
LNKAEKDTIKAHLNAEQKALQELEKAYKQAKKDCQERIKALNARTDMQNLQTIVHQRKYQQVLLKQIDGVLNDLQTHTYKSANEFFQSAYENGYIGSMYEFIYQDIPLTIPISRKKMMTAIQTDSKISKDYYLKQGLTVQNIRTLKQQIAQEATRGIASGKSWLEVANSLSIQRYFSISLSDAMRICRTEGNRINQQARLDAGDEAVKAGCDLLKQWDATMDDKTRPWHREADGQIVEWDEDFTVMGEKLKAPSIGGSAKNVINCRCQLLKRPRWALDEEELERLKKRADYFGLDKSQSFEEYKQKYLTLPVTPQGNVETIQDMQKRLEDMQASKRKYESDLSKAKRQESLGDYLEQNEGYLKNAYDDVADLTDADLKEMQNLAKHADEYSKKYAEVDQMLKEIREQRPNYEDFDSDDLYDKAFEEFLQKRSDLREEREHLMDLMYKASDAKGKLDRYNDFIQRYEQLKKTYKTHAELLNDIKTLQDQIADLDKSIPELKKLIREHPDFWSIYKSPILKRLEGSKIKNNPVKRRTAQITEDEIINRLSGGDQTEGSCASLALAYIGQKDNLDVLDFRDGESREFFSFGVTRRLEQIEGIVGWKSKESQSECLWAWHLMEDHMEVGKEYSLTTGSHASIVRKLESGEYQYLELQSQWCSGWQSMGKDKKTVMDAINWRWGASKRSQWLRTSHLYDIDSFKGNKDFERILGYINTVENEQKKGSSGTIK